MATETLVTLRNRIRLRLQDPNKKLWDDDDIDYFVDLGIADIQQKTQWMEDVTYTHVVAGQADYNRDTDKIESMKYQVWDRWRMENITQYELDRAKFDWRMDTSGIPKRIYQKDWSSDTLWPPPAVTGDAFNDTQEFGICTYMKDDATGAFITTDNAELGLVSDEYRNDIPEGFLTLRANYDDPNSDSFGIETGFFSPYGNLMNVFVRWPTNTINDTDVVPFPVWVHYAVEVYALSKAFQKIGDAQNPGLADAYRSVYDNIWVPFIRRIVAGRTPDHMLVWSAKKTFVPKFAPRITKRWTGYR